MPPPKIKIMVVEDDEQSSALIAAALNTQGYEAIVVNDSSRALSIAESARPQAFLLDLVMPPPDGFKLCRMLRVHPDFKYSPILIVAALDHTDSKIIAIGAGANGYLVKPFRSSELISRVQDLLGE
ncbi:MAG TPA: response regulator transcription factor [Anaerolineales bacterium]|nr:response regulator transcription factor [Anaerolineales bacterium]